MLINITMELSLQKKKKKNCNLIVYNYSSQENNSTKLNTDSSLLDSFDRAKKHVKNINNVYQVL